MMYAHEGQTPAEREQVERHWAHTSEEAWQQYRRRSVDWWDLAQLAMREPSSVNEFVSALTVRPLPQPVPELDTFEPEIVDVWTVEGRVI